MIGQRPVRTRRFPTSASICGRSPLAAATVVADCLASPDRAAATVTGTAWWRQSLAHGAPGVALLHIELAVRDMRPWQRAQDWINYLASAPVTTGPDSHLYYGAPALAHVLACAAACRSGAYHAALDQLDRDLAEQARRRVDAAHDRIDHGALPVLAEFDLIRGLSGLGAHLLRRDPQGQALRRVLECLVRLAEPIRHEDEQLPGWWTPSAPTGRESPEFVGGHANTGVAHGIAGPLALLSLACRADVRVDGQADAIGRILAWLDRWRADTAAGPVWPYWINRGQLRSGHRPITDAARPSWCYGTAGLARAQQLAGLATGDPARQRLAEHALIQALSDTDQYEATVDGSLCHGHSGLALVAQAVAADADPATAQQLRAVLPDLWAAASNPILPTEPGLLEGSTGYALAGLAVDDRDLSRTGWQSCLLITSPTRNR